MDNELCNDASAYDIKLKYGLRNGDLIDISEITKEQKGLKCNCTCPGCGRKLQARLGNGKKQPHFAHNGEACNLVAAQQSALHILAKDIIKEEMKVCFPSLKVKMTDIPQNVIKSYYYDVPEELVYKPSQILVCEKVELEKKVSDIVPDIVVTIGGKECLIEIAVTHFIDEVKNEKIKRIGLPVVEIDLSDLSREDYSKESIRKVLLNDNELKRWVYNPKSEEAYNWALNQYKDKVVEIEQKEIEQEKIAKEKREQRIKKRMISQQLIDDLQIDENYEKAIKNIRNDDSLRYYLKKRTFYSENMELPFYMDIPITGEMVFKCDRRVWQSAIFDKFVYNRKPSEKHYVNIIRVESWVTKRQKEFQLDWDLVSKANYSFGNVIGNHNLFHACLEEYLKRLSYIGFLISDSYRGDYEVVAINTLNPPCKETALRLETVIKEVNQYSWNVSREIYSMLESKPIFIERYEISDNRKVDYDLGDFIERTKTLFQPKLSKREIDYKAGRDEIISNNSLVGDGIAKDSFGFRWLVCTECGEIKREDEMITYQGNTGICRDCSRRKNDY